MKFFCTIFKKCMMTSMMLVFLFSIIIIPVKSTLTTGAVQTVSPSWSLTMSAEKVLDLSASDLNITFTKQDEERLRQEAIDEFQTNLIEMVENILEKQRELEEKGICLKLPDGNYNPEWDKEWKKVYPADNDNSIAREFQKRVEAKLKQAIDSGETRDAIFWNWSDYTDLIAQNSKTKWQAMVKAALTALGTGFYPREGENKMGIKDDKTVPFLSEPGTLEWHKQYDSALDGSDLGNFLNKLRMRYVDVTYTDKRNSLLREKIGDQIKAKFDFDLQVIPANQEEKFGIGQIKNGMTIIRGTLDNDTKESIHLSTVDFGAENQVTDESFDELRKGVINNDFQSLKKIYPELEENKDQNGDNLDHIQTMLYRYQAILGSSSEPKVHFAGTIPPYNHPYGLSSVRRGLREGSEWFEENLADYGPYFTSTYNYVEVIPIAGELTFLGIGANFYRPIFDEYGKMIAIAKPLLNALSDPRKFKIEADENQERYGLDYFEFLSIFEKIDKAQANSIHRFKLVERFSGDIKFLNGNKIMNDTSEKIIDIEKGGSFLIFNNLQDANDYYEKKAEFEKGFLKWESEYPELFASLENSDDKEILWNVLRDNLPMNYMGRVSFTNRVVSDKVQVPDISVEKGKSDMNQSQSQSQAKQNIVKTSVGSKLEIDILMLVFSLSIGILLINSRKIFSKNN